MQIHLSKYDIILLRDKAVESFEAEDEGDAFAEEAIGCFEANDIETIESRAGGSADNYMREIFESWDGVDPMELVEMLAENLVNIDIELTFDDVDGDDDENESSSDWNDVEDDNNEEENDDFLY